MLKRFFARSWIYGALAPFLIFSAAPFYVMLVTMIKRSHDLFSPTNNPFLLNEPATLEHLDLLFNHTLYLRFLANTFVVGVAVVAVTVLLAVPAALSIARLAGRWGDGVGIGIFLTYLVPPTLLFLPLSRAVSTLGLQNSLWSLILVYPTFTVPFCTWLMMSFFKAIPKDIEEQALVDGCSRTGAMVKVLLPLSVPGIITVVVFTFTLVAHEYIYALAFIQDSAWKTIGIGMTTELVRGDVFYWGALMGGALIASIPVAVLYTLFLDRIISGMALGTSKR
jgi:multiple sugar transport system permease protein